MGDELITTKIAEEAHSSFEHLMARARTTIDVNKQVEKMRNHQPY